MRSQLEPLRSCPSTAATPATDAELCVAFGDVDTIVENADIGLADGRMQAQEQEGWYRLATRVLDRLTTAGETDVGAAIAALQEAAPPVASGSGFPTGIGSSEWTEAAGALLTACDAVGSPLELDVFTGG